MPQEPARQDAVPRSAEAIVRSYFNRFNETKEAQLEGLDPEIEWHLRIDLPDARVARGYGDVKSLNADWNESFEELRIEPIEITEVSGRTLVLVHFHGRIRGSSQELEMDEAWLLRWRKDKIIEIHEYNTRAEALKAVGIEE